MFSFFSFDFFILRFYFKYSVHHRLHQPLALLPCAPEFRFGGSAEGHELVNPLLFDNESTYGRRAYVYAIPQSTALGGRNSGRSSAVSYFVE